MEKIGVHGIITLHEIPSEWTDEDFKYWWCPVTDEHGKVLQPARISDEAKAARIVMQRENIITNAGIALDLANRCVTGQGSMFPFYQITSLGNGAIAGVTRADTAVAGDAFATGARKAPASFAVVGFSSQVLTNLLTTDAVGTITNIGIYGYNTGGSQAATTSAGTGALMTHALYPFIKGSTAYGLNYTFVMTN